MRRYLMAAAGAALLSVAAEGEAMAADTVEPTAHGTVDLEAYAGWEGMGRPRDERGVVGDVLLGVGLLPRFCAYVGTTFSGDETFDRTSRIIAMGLIGTIVDTDHVDLDLSLDGSVAASSEGGLSIGPCVELNVDARPDLQLAGGYVRLSAPLYGIETDPTASGLRQEHGIHLNLVAVTGGYVTLGEIHQILLEVDFWYDLDIRHGDRAVDMGGIALGYNVGVHEALELISQIYLDVPAHGGRTSVGFLVGLIGTLAFRK